MKRLLRNKFFKSIIILIIATVLFIIQDYIQSEISGIDTKVSIFVAKYDLSSKKKISEDDIKEIEVLITQTPQYSILDSKDIIGKYIIDPVTTGDFMLSNNLSDIKYYEYKSIKEGYSIVSIPLNIDSAAGWRIEKEQEICIMFSPFQYKEPEETDVIIDEIKEPYKFYSEDVKEVIKSYDEKDLYEARLIKDIKVVDIINEALESISDETFVGIPKYIVVSLKSEQAEFIALAKDKGRFDIIISN